MFIYELVSTLSLKVKIKESTKCPKHFSAALILQRYYVTLESYFPVYYLHHKNPASSAYTTYMRHTCNYVRSYEDFKKNNRCYELLISKQEKKICVGFNGLDLQR